MKQRKEQYAHGLAGAGGLVTALLIGGTGDSPAPWSLVSYYWLGWPLMCLIVYLLARSFPLRPWRWTMSMAVGQVFATILLGGGDMAPVALIYTLILSAPQFIIGAVGSRRSPYAVSGDAEQASSREQADGNDEGSPEEENS